MKFFLHGFLGLIALGSAALAGENRAEGFAKLPSLADLTKLFQPLRYDDATLSPDGRFVAYTETGSTTASSTSGEFHVSVVIQSVDVPESLSTVDGGEAVSFLDWTPANRLVFVSNRTDVHYLKPPSGGPMGGPAYFESENDPRVLGPRDTELHSVDASGKNERTLLDTKSLAITDSMPRRPLILGLSTGRDNAIIVRAAPEFPNQRFMGFYRVNAANGSRSVISNQEFSAKEVLADKTGMPRVAFEKGPVWRASYSESKGKDWKTAMFAEGRLPVNFTTDPANYFSPRETPVAFDFDPNILYYASNVGRDTFGLYALNLKTKARTDFRLEDPAFDLIDPSQSFPSSNLVWDRFKPQLNGVRVIGVKRSARWVDAEIAKLQSQFDANFSTKTVEIINWDEKRQRFLLLTTGGTDPGRYYIYDRTSDLYTQFLRREPLLEPDAVHPMQVFSIPQPSGAPLTGYLTQPLNPVIASPPVVFVLHGGPWLRAWPDYNPQTQALAAMGFVVVEINYHGSRGFGTRFFQEIYAGLDRVPLADVLATIKWLAAEKNIKSPKIALVGEGFGGFLAVRALQLYPEVFSCAVAIKPLVNLEDETLYFGDRMDRARDTTWRLRAGAYAHVMRQNATPLKELSLLRDPDLIKAPIMLLQNSNLGRSETAKVQNVHSLRAAVQKTGGTAEYVELATDFDKGVPAARARTFYQIQEFLTACLYDFNVKIDNLKVQEDKK